MKEQSLSLQDIDSLLQESTNLQKKFLQDRVLDLVDNPTQCIVVIEGYLDRYSAEYIEQMTEEVWDHFSKTERRFAAFKRPAYECCSCSDITTSTSILCHTCWHEDVEDYTPNTFHSQHNTYEDNGTVFFNAAPLQFAPFNHFFSIK